MPSPVINQRQATERAIRMGKGNTIARILLATAAANGDIALLAQPTLSESWDIAFNDKLRQIGEQREIDKEERSILGMTDEEEVDDGGIFSFIVISNQGEMDL
ncbi:MAG: hypothetical protein EZS28_021721 [Streblomastix strix]|uniref:Uncharacterized protein n=1 Tax=Streblomastix strix TaxID=222440 RepID=A0A5J4VKL9_9EUKA|nr:MAG: hypothetical protein EZS28_021721 [Streblomastix strix]